MKKVFAILIQIFLLINLLNAQLKITEITGKYTGVLPQKMDYKTGKYITPAKHTVCVVFKLEIL